jgi:hypothetical protein
MQTYANSQIDQLVWIGFCQPKFYKPSVWVKAKAMMLLAVKMGIGVEHRPIRGAGHFWTKTNLKIESVIWALVQKYGNPSEPFIVKQYGKTYEVYDLENGKAVEKDLLSKDQADVAAKNHNLLKQVMGVAV